MPRISVILPAYNCAAFIHTSIASVLAQTMSDFELVIVDDGSTDETGRIVQGYEDKRIVFLKNEKNCGIGRALNNGIAAARADLIARLDADDIMLPWRLERQVQFLEINPRVTIIRFAHVPFSR